MKKNFTFSNKFRNARLLTTILMAVISTQTILAYDVAVKNEDGKRIFYNYINDSTELEVTSGTYYIDDIKIPETVNIYNVIRKVTRIGNSAFNGCSGLTSVTIPNNVTYIGHYAFTGCSNLTSIIIPNSVTRIGDYAFNGCNGLTSITIPNGLTYIGSFAFQGCLGLKKVIVEDLAIWCNIYFSNERSNPLCFAHNLYSDENTKIKNLVIPDGITYIRDYAFYQCSGLTSVTIPNSVTSIGNFAFRFCSSLTSITIPNSVTSIGVQAFESCSLTSVTIPNSVTSIKYGAFDGCDRIKKVIVKDLAAWCGISFGSSSSNPLYYAENLYKDELTKIKNLVIPDGVTHISDYAFYHCSGLTSITIPNGVTHIENSAFYGCTGLTSITIPASVTSISSGAFSDNNNLAEIVSLIQEPFKVGNIVSDFTYNNATLYVPEGTIEKYKVTDNWKLFTNIKEGVQTSIKNVKTDNQTAVIYTLDGKRLNITNAANLPKGIYIINGKKVMIK